MFSHRSFLLPQLSGRVRTLELVVAVGDCVSGFDFMKKKDDFGPPPQTTSKFCCLITSLA